VDRVPVGVIRLVSGPVGHSEGSAGTERERERERQSCFDNLNLLQE